MLRERRWVNGNDRALISDCVACRRPSAPADVSAWPSILLIECKANPKISRSIIVNASHIAPTSIGSPRGVPVPCICIVVICFGSALEMCIARHIRACCDGPFGAVSELENPSWLRTDEGNDTEAQNACLQCSRCWDLTSATAQQDSILT